MGRRAGGHPQRVLRQGDGAGAGHQPLSAFHQLLRDDAHRFRHRRSTQSPPDGGQHVSQSLLVTLQGESTAVRTGGVQPALAGGRGARSALRLIGSELPGGGGDAGGPERRHGIPRALRRLLLPREGLRQGGVPAVQAVPQQRAAGGPDASLPGAPAAGHVPAGGAAVHPAPPRPRACQHERTLARKYSADGVVPRAVSARPGALLLIRPRRRTCTFILVNYATIKCLSQNICLRL